MWPLILWDTLDFPIDPLGHLTCPLTPWEPMGFPLGPLTVPQNRAVGAQFRFQADASVKTFS